MLSREPTRGSARITEATAVVATGSVQAVGDMQTSRAAAQAAEAAAAGAHRAASLSAGVAGVAGAVALAAAL